MAPRVPGCRGAERTIWAATETRSAPIVDRNERRLGRSPVRTPRKARAVDSRQAKERLPVLSRVMIAAPSPIEFVLDDLDSGEQRVTPTVDGITLIELVRDYETAVSFDVPGGYDRLIIDRFRFGDLGAYLSGKTDVWPGPGKVALLGCSCGELGCWPLFAQVGETDKYVVWDRFEQPYRNDRDYSGFEPFLFDRRRYADALHRLAVGLS